MEDRIMKYLTILIEMSRLKPYFSKIVEIKVNRNKFWAS